jgi:transcriptional regulator with XRE-family HTH domain
MTDYHYVESGLDNVFIEGIQPVLDDDGDEAIIINSVNILHAVIAEGIVRHSHSMSGKELRFLRTEMGLTQSDLGDFVHVDRQTVARWEKGQTAIDPKAETLIRKMAIEKLSLPLSDSIEALSRSAKPANSPQNINISAETNSYRLIAA